jgi:hypothetical protein
MLIAGLGFTCAVLGRETDRNESEARSAIALRHQLRD